MNFFHSFIPVLQTFIENYGSLGVFLASVIEELIPPIPSALVQGLGGMLLMLNEPFSVYGLFKVVLIVSIPAAIGICVGSLPYWYLAHKYGISIIEKYGKFLGTNIDDWNRLEKRLNQSSSDEYLFVLARAVPVVPAIVLAIYSGAVNMPLWKYLYLSFIGTLIRATVLATAGWVLGVTLIKNVSGLIESIEKITVFVLVLVLAFFVYKNYR